MRRSAKIYLYQQIETGLVGLLVSLVLVYIHGSFSWLLLPVPFLYIWLWIIFELKIYFNSRKIFYPLLLNPFYAEVVFHSIIPNYLKLRNVFAWFKYLIKNQ
jgi:hypothetical protein